MLHRKREKYSWNSAPTVLPEWTGRDDLLAQITEDWNNPQKHVTGLIGFGGEGKSSLHENGLMTSLGQGRSRTSAACIDLDGVFWWGFYENRSIDEFLEAALNFLSGGQIDPRQVPSSSLRAQIIGAMLGAGRYLFVLDGLEVLQHQEGDQYGLLQSNDLRDLLTYFARPDNQSFCLITSRAPVLDLMEYTTYTHRDVDRLSEADGIALLKKLGVHPSPLRRGAGGEVELAKVVSDWDGHALTISLLGSYLAEKYDGDIAHLADIPIPTADEPRYERVHRVLRGCGAPNTAVIGPARLLPGEGYALILIQRAAIPTDVFQVRQTGQNGHQELENLGLRTVDVGLLVAMERPSALGSGPDAAQYWPAGRAGHVRCDSARSHWRSTAAPY